MTERIGIIKGMAIGTTATIAFGLAVSGFGNAIELVTPDFQEAANTVKNYGLGMAALGAAGVAVTAGAATLRGYARYAGRQWKKQTLR